MADGNNIRDQLGVIATTNVTDNPVFTILNGLLGSVWRACAQHQTHIALIEAQGLEGLADAMRIRTADEPITIRALVDRLHSTRLNETDLMNHVISFYDHRIVNEPSLKVN